MKTMLLIIAFASMAQAFLPFNYSTSSMKVIRTVRDTQIVLLYSGEKIIDTIRVTRWAHDRLHNPPPSIDTERPWRTNAIIKVFDGKTIPDSQIYYQVTYYDNQTHITLWDMRIYIIIADTSYEIRKVHWSDSPYNLNYEWLRQIGAPTISFAACFIVIIQPATPTIKANPGMPRIASGSKRSIIVNACGRKMIKTHKIDLLFAR
jgi:hypothetical protein